MAWDTERTKQLLLDAATEEISSFGLAGARIDRIAASAGVHKERIRATIDAGQMLCRECDVITPAHDSGLCPMCRGDEEGNDEHKAWLEFEAGWLERNLCVKRG